MDDFNMGPADFIIGFITSAVLTSLLWVLLLPEGNLVGVKTDKVTNTKYIEYNDSIYTLVPYKNIIKEK